MSKLHHFIPSWTGYELLDTGAGKKLERFDAFTLVRPEPQANWAPQLPAEIWQAADAEFVKSTRDRQGKWIFRNPLPKRWPIPRNKLKFWIAPAPSGHVGVFPDQACHWDWITEVTSRAQSPANVLCLFGHTGLATLAAAAADAKVTHVDASRKAVAWARDNQALSNLSDRPIRWIVEDALTFVSREVRRGNKYDALILDPPRFGRGPKGEIWKLDESLPELLRACRRLLTPSPAFVLLNLYTTVLSRTRIDEDMRALRARMEELLIGFSMKTSVGRLTLQDSAGREITASIFARAI